MSYFGFRDKFGWIPSFTPAKDLRTITPHRLVGTDYGSTIDANFHTATNSGAGSASGVASGIATLSSGTANSGYGQLSTVRTARFMFVHPNMYRTGIIIPDVTEANCTRRWGAFTVSGQTPQNGFYYELSGAGVLSVNVVKGGSVTPISSGSFNGQVSTYTMDTNAHAYEIVYFEMQAKFIIDNVVIHTFTPTTSKMVNTFNLPAVATAINSAGGTESGSIIILATSILRLGAAITAGAYKHLTTAATTVCKIGSGHLQRITINNPGGTLVTIYDNTAGSGTVIAIINTPAQANPVTLDYGIDFYTGLTIVTTGTWDLTVVYE